MIKKILRLVALATMFGLASTAQASIQDVYNFYDPGLNGLSKTEYDNISSDIAAYFGQPAPVSLGKKADLDENGFVNFADYAVLTQLKQMSARYMIDTNKDGRVTLTEALAAFERVRVAFGKGADQSGYDTTADFDPTNFINYADYAPVQSVIDADDVLRVEYNAFRKADVDANGSISYNEAKAVADAISGSFGKSSTDAGFSSLADMNGNGFVNFDDTSLLIRVLEPFPNVQEQIMAYTQISSSDEPLTLTPIPNQVVNAGELLAVKVIGQSRKLVPSQDKAWVEGTGNIWPAGDVSMNWEITSYDAALVLQEISQPSMTEHQRKLADINDDGQVTQSDADMMMQIAVDSIEHPGHYWYLRLPRNSDNPWGNDVIIGITNHNTARVNFTVIEEGSSTDDGAIGLVLDEAVKGMPTGSVATSKFDLYPDGPVSILQVSRAKVGQPVRVRSMIRNGGTATAPVHAVRMEVRSYSDADYRYEEVQQMPTLRRNQGRYVIFTWTPPVAGKYYVDVVVDSGNVVVEKNELNNRARVGVFFEGSELGSFALKSPEQGVKWTAGERQRLMFDRDGLAKSSVYKLYLVDSKQVVSGPYDVTTGTNNSIGYFTPDRTLAPGEYRVVVASCHVDQACDMGNSRWATSMSIGLVQLMNNARVLGDSDDMDEDEVEIEDEIEVEDEAGEDDYVANEASMVRKIDDKLVNRLKGRILLQVEKRGQAWYVDPVTGDRFYLKDGAAAYIMFHRAGLGITNRDLARIPVGLNDGTDEVADTDGDGLPDLLEVALGTNPEEADSDGDGFDDTTEVRQMYNPRGKDKQATDNALINRLKGRILLQVEDKGQAWYLSPVDGKRYLLSDGEQAYRILRKLSLGVKDTDLQKISVGVME